MFVVKHKMTDIVENNQIDTRDMIIWSLMDYITKNIDDKVDLDSLTKYTPYKISKTPIPIYKTRYESDFIEEEKIGKGGFGKVYKTTNIIDGRQYAIKKIPLIGHFLNEVKIFAKLEHQNIVRYYSSWIQLSNRQNPQFNLPAIEYEKEIEDLFESYDSSDSSSYSSGNIVPYSEIESIGDIFIQMELCQMSLDYYLEKNQITIEQIKQIINAISYLHSNCIIHCDISPQNFLISSTGMIKLNDFGLAEDLGNNEYVIRDNKYGSPAYQSPETKTMNKYSYKSDIYSLGVLLYEITLDVKTTMEKVVSIEKFKDKKMKLNNPLLYMMIDENEDNRPSITQIIENFNKIK